MSDESDLSSPYLAHRESVVQKAAGDAMLAEMEAAEGLAKEADTLAAPKPNDPPTAGGRIGRVSRDIGRGIVEVPRAVVTGAFDAAQATVDTAADLADWMNKTMPVPGLIHDAQGWRWGSAEEVAGTPAMKPKLPLPEIADPESVTGKMVKGVAQFTTGMAATSGAFKGFQAVKGLSSYGVSALHGAAATFAAFDAEQQRLSDLVEKFPALSNPVTRFLQSQPDDSAAESRFKNALEGLGLGLLTDGFVKSVRVLRNAASSRLKLQEAAQEVQPTLADDAFKALGSEADNAPLVKRPPALKAKPGEVLDEAAPQTYINFARINEPEDVQRVMQRVADMATPGADEARAGVRSFEQVKLDAAHEDAWKVLMARRSGEPLTDSQSVAARELWAASGRKLEEVAELAAAAPNEANLFAFRKMLDTHAMVQREVLGARAATARALASWRIPVGGPTERLRNVAMALEQSGGTEVARELAQRVAMLSRAGMTKELQAVIEKTAYARTRDAVVEGWINGLISGPQTHAANLMSNTSVIALRMAERAVGGRISRLLGDADGIAAGEAAANWFGAVQGAKDMFTYYAKAARLAATGDLKSAQALPSPAAGIGAAGSKIEVRPGAISADALKLSGHAGRAADFLGSVARVPGRALEFEDDFFKTVGYRMEVNAQAVRQASRDVAAGRVAQDGYKARVAELAANPPENIRLAAADAALYQTFQNTPGTLAKSIGKLTHEYPALKFILPFTRTPANILKFTFERTPLAPLMKSVRADIAAGGARRDLALAQIATGTSAMLAFADMTMNGQITGRGPPERGVRGSMAREGWSQYSLKAGDRWVPYSRFDPVGSLIGMSADATELIMQAGESAADADTETLLAATALAFAGNITNKTYLSGLSSTIEALNDPTVNSERFIQRLAGSVVPALVGQGTRAVDPVAREVNSMMDAIRARIPGLSDNLPARHDLWGDPMDNGLGLGTAVDFFSPIRARKPSPEPVDQELLRLESNLGMPPPKTSFNGVTVNLDRFPGAYQRYVQLAGNELKHPAWGMGAKDLLNAIVTGDHPLSTVYRMRTDGPEGGKDMFIRKIVNDYREDARRQLLTEYPEIATDVAARQKHQQAFALGG